MDRISESIKIAELYTALVLNDEEFESRKDALIASIAHKPITVSAEDFLIAILELKVNGVLDDSDIKKIRALIM
jgi:hypothetical protein